MRFWVRVATLTLSVWATACPGAGPAVHIEGAGEDAGHDGGAGDSAVGADGGAPEIASITPQVVGPATTLYVRGAHFQGLGDVVDGQTTAALEVLPEARDAGLDADAAADDAASPTPRRIQLRILSITPEALTASISGALGDFTGQARLVLSTPHGTVASRPSLTLVTDDIFAGPTPMGHGLLGIVYGLARNTQRLPSFVAPCAGPPFSSSPTLPCPFSSILLPNLDIRPQAYPTGIRGAAEPLSGAFAIEFAGHLQTQAHGTYGLRLCSDDGARLFLDGALVIDDDGIHGPLCGTASVALGLGDHRFVLDYFQGVPPGLALRLLWTPPHGSEVPIPNEAFVLDIP